MSFFDITPAGAFVNAVEAAHAKDRQNARRAPKSDDPATPRATFRAIRAVRSAIARLVMVFAG